MGWVVTVGVLEVAEVEKVVEVVWAVVVTVMVG